MALKNYAGFAEGFTGGLNAMGGIIDRKNKKDLQDETLTLSKEKFAFDQKTTTEELGIKKTSAEALSALNTIKANTAALQAQTAASNSETAGVKAATAAATEERKSDPNSPENRKIAAAIAQSEAQATASASRAKVNQANAESRVNEQNQMNNARLVNQMWEITGGDPEKIYSENELAAVSNIMDNLNGAGLFDLNVMMTDSHQNGQQAIQTFLTDLSSGQNVEMSPEVLTAMTSALGLRSSAAVGRVVDESFVNAPDWMKTGDYRVQRQGLYQVTSGDNSQISGQLYVMVADGDGNEYPYFPPLTSGRSMTTGKPVTLDFNQSVQAMAGQSHMMNAVTPRLKRIAREAKIKADFGSPKGNSGVVSFNETVEKKMAAYNAVATEGNGNNLDLLGISVPKNPDGSVNATAFKSAKTQLELRRAVEERILFKPPSTSDHKTIKELLTTQEELLRTAVVSSGEGNVSTTLGELLNRANTERLTPQAVSNLTGMFQLDKNGIPQPEKPKELQKYLRKMGWLGANE